MKLPYLDNPIFYCDSYKLAHWDEIPTNVTRVLSNWTGRYLRPERVEQGVTRQLWFGLQAFLQQLTEDFQELFFDKPEEECVERFVDFFKRFFNTEVVPLTTVEKVRALHKLGYLPLEVWSVPEGSLVPMRIPTAQHWNTIPEFMWFTNFIETYYSCSVWHPTTSATTAAVYRKNFEKYAEETSDQGWFVDFQGHDFSMRGLEHIAVSGPSVAGHLVNFKGTDTLPAIGFIDNYYPGENGLLGTSVPATEHMVMCAGGENNEVETFKRLITEVHPTGIVSIVSDTWSLWDVLTKIAVELKDVIEARGPKDGIPGKVVFRPDSSPKTPVEIICGDPEAEPGTPEHKGAIRLLYEVFGGTRNSKGYVELNPAVGLIYGDAISLDVQKKILEGLKQAGFASTNIVMGIGSFTYQFVTRDSQGNAIKCTYVEIDGRPTPVYKDPVTDTSGKKSARGVQTVHYDVRTGEYTAVEYTSLAEALLDQRNYMRLVYRNGQFFNRQSFADVRRVAEEQRKWI